jgi:hypothetical protein
MEQSKKNDEARFRKCLSMIARAGGEQRIDGRDAKETQTS